MDSNTHSTPPLAGPPARWPADLPADPSADPPAGPPDALTAVLDRLAAEDLDRLSDATLNQDLARLQRQLDGLQGQWLRRLAALDARGAAGADQGEPALSTAGWLRRRLRLSASAASGAVRTARALFRGPLAATAQALLAGELSPAHATAVADGTQQLPGQVVAEAEPVLLEAARQLDPAQLRRLVAQLCLVADPDGADRQAERRQERRGVWLSPTWDDMVAINGLLEREAGATVLAALEPLARPASADDPRTGSQRNADALAELCRRSLEGGWLPKAGGVRPQLLVTVDLDSLLGRSGGLGGDLGWAGPLDPEGCRRLACDGAVTRVLVSRQPTHAHRPSGASADHDRAVAHDPTTDHGPATDLDPGATDQSGTGNPSSVQGLQEDLRAAMALLPPTLGGAPRQPLEVGRATRVVQPAQRAALAVRDRGCVFPGCDRPLAWCDAHHLWHWVDGGPTDLANLAMVCRAHHRTVHEGGWQLTRGPDGRFTTSPRHRRSRRSHRHRHPSGV
jgi:hypothetical protein